MSRLDEARPATTTARAAMATRAPTPFVERFGIVAKELEIEEEQAERRGLLDELGIDSIVLIGIVGRIEKVARHAGRSQRADQAQLDCRAAQYLAAWAISRTEGGLVQPDPEQTTPGTVSARMSTRSAGGDLGIVRLPPRRQCRRHPDTVFQSPSSESPVVSQVRSTRKPSGGTRPAASTA